MTETQMNQTCTAFCGGRQLATGSRRAVASALVAASQTMDPILVFDDTGAWPVEFDLRGDLAAVLARLPQEEAAAARGPGRPRLGVMPREVTLLPRHWDWLSGQPGGASVALRKLVEAAMREADGPDRIRKGREAAYRFMTAMAGDLPGYEAAVRALFAGDPYGFDAATAGWPRDIVDYANGRLAGAVQA
ncbi:DUF2239 family protein [soil metagenome]